jgi:hypothetical protein
MFTDVGHGLIRQCFLLAMFEGTGCSIGAANERYNCERRETHGFRRRIKTLERGEMKIEGALILLSKRTAVLYTS